MTELANKGMKLSKPEYRGGSWPLRLSVIQSGFAAYAQCYPDQYRADVIPTCGRS
jgi:hypothetical protein